MVIFELCGQCCLVGGFDRGTWKVSGDPSGNKSPYLKLVLPSDHLSLPNDQSHQKLEDEGACGWILHRLASQGIEKTGEYESTQRGEKSKCPDQLLKIFFPLDLKDILFNIKHYRQLRQR